MNEKMKYQWLDALRSGKFNQCKLYLKVLKDEKMCHCAMGVAVELFIPEKFVNTEGKFYNFATVSNTYALLKAATGMSVDMFGKVINCNDNGGSYEDCAKIIESFEAV